MKFNFSNLFNKSIKISRKQPQTNEIWHFVGYKSNDPFPPRINDCFSKITDVKNGWVRYAIGYMHNGQFDGGSRLFSDERMSVESFMGMYKFHSEEKTF